MYHTTCTVADLCVCVALSFVCLGVVGVMRLMFVFAFASSWGTQLNLGMYLCNHRMCYHKGGYHLCS